MPAASHGSRCVDSPHSRSAHGRSPSRERRERRTPPLHIERVEPSPCRHCDGRKLDLEGRDVRLLVHVATPSRRGLGGDDSGPYSFAVPGSSFARPVEGQLSGALRFLRSHALADNAGRDDEGDLVAAQSCRRSEDRAKQYSRVLLRGYARCACARHDRRTL